MKIETSIIIPTRNVGKRFEKTLKAIFEQVYNKPFEVIIVDSNSTDETIEIAKKYPVKILRFETGNLTHGQSRNYGAEKSQGKYLVFITGDAVPVDNTWLQKLTEPLDNPEIGAVYGRQLPEPQVNPMEKFLLLVRYPSYRIVKSKKTGLEKVFRDNLIISNVNSAVKKELWEKFKFPEDVIMAEDRGLGKKILLDGWTILYIPEAAVYHSHNYNLKTVFQRYFDEGITLNQLYEPDEFNIKMQFFEGIKYLLREIYFLMTNNYILWVPYALIYNFVKFLAMFLGTKEKYIPLKIKKKLSRYSNYWEAQVKKQ